MGKYKHYHHTWNRHISTVLGNLSHVKLIIFKIIATDIRKIYRNKSESVSLKLTEATI